MANMHQRKEPEIMQNWKVDIEKPVVSICSIIYNHENYIAEAIDGFLMQETSFPFEILINDDCSTDNTVNILREYEKKYPNIVKPIYQKENQYSKGIKMNSTYNFPRAKGKYIAICEGDDYWTDPLKLQKQVDFLEVNKDYSICGTKFTELGGNNTTSGYEGTYLLEAALKHNKFGTLTVMFRKKYLTQEAYTFVQGKPTGDWPLWVYLMKHGKGYVLKDVTSKYRIHGGGVYGKIGKIKQLLIRVNTYKIFLKDNLFTEKEKETMQLSGKNLLKTIFSMNSSSSERDSIQKLLYEDNLFLSKWEKYILILAWNMNNKLFINISWRIL